MRTLERILLAKMEFYILHQLGLSQFGYRKTLSTDMDLAQLDTTDGWRESAFLTGRSLAASAQALLLLLLLLAGSRERP